MAPAVSRLRAEAGLGALPQRALAQYLLFLRLYPVLTKAATSGILSALGNFLAQMIEKKRKKENSGSLDVGGPLRYAVYGFFFTGPLSHFFYLFMEHWIPPEVPLAGLRRLLLDRLVFAPAFLMLFFLIMNFLEGKDASAFATKMRGGFWPALRMNWRVQREDLLGKQPFRYPVHEGAAVGTESKVSDWGWAGGAETGAPGSAMGIKCLYAQPGSPGPLRHWEDGVQHPLQHGRTPQDAAGGGLAESAAATCFPPLQGVPPIRVLLALVGGHPCLLPQSSRPLERQQLCGARDVGANSPDAGPFWERREERTRVTPEGEEGGGPVCTHTAHTTNTHIRKQQENRGAHRQDKEAVHP
ncbi:hypothetical protein H8959_015528 [Pygathrix nigripes]